MKSRQLKLCVLILIAIIWFIVILPYFLLQTELGSRFTSQFISQYSDNYIISIERVSHSMGKPLEMTLENVIIKDKNQATTYLSAEKLVVGLKFDFKQSYLWQAQSLDYLLIENGNLVLSPTMLQATSNISVGVLQLKNVSLRYQDNTKNINITLEKIYGGISPWSNQLITERQDTLFNFTIEKINYNHFNSQAVLLQGSQQNHILRLDNFGGNINQGFFTANAEILPDNSMVIDKLKINKLHFLSMVELSDINELFMAFPKTEIKQLSIVDSSIKIPDFSIEKGNLDIKNLSYQQGWNLYATDLSFNAQSIIWHDELIEDPLLRWHYEDNKIIIKQAIALWNKSNIKLSGSLQNNHLTIDSIIASSLRYQLPDNWYSSMTTAKIPNYFPSYITIKQFTLMPSLIMDTNPELPFQFSHFGVLGHDIKFSIVDNSLFIDGKVLLKADIGILNTVELKKPDLIIALTPKNTAITFSSLIDQGMLEGEADLLSAKQIQSLTLNAHAINSQVLSRWHLVNNPVNSAKFVVKLQGSLAPLSLNGVLQNQGNEYLIENNQIIYH